MFVNSSHRQVPRDLLSLGVCLMRTILPSWAGVFLVMSHAGAAEFNIRPISDETLIGREPTISSNGLAAWISYNTNDVATENSTVMVYWQNDLQDIVGGTAGGIYGATKPIASGTSVVFVASIFGRRSAPTWELVEVENRHEEGQREVPALYAAFERDGAQVLEPIIDPDATNLTRTITVTNEAGEVVEERTEPIKTLRHPSGEAEIWRWNTGALELDRITVDLRNDFLPSFDDDIITWQKAKGFPFGWEIMARVATNYIQLTTNYYYDMGPVAQGRNVAWYGWDGYDYEIYLYDADTDQTVQITSNRYDDVAPVMWDGVVVWEGYPAVEADIFMWKDGEIRNISQNLDDDLYPRIWDGHVVWQGFDGDDFEIFYYNVEQGGEAIKLTTNTYDDTNPDIRDNLIIWSGYFDNWDAEIFAIDMKSSSFPDQQDYNPLTENEEDDLYPKTAGGRIIWQHDQDGQYRIMLAEPR